MKIVIDTNAWIYALSHKVRILEELAGNEIYILENTVNELLQIAKTQRKESVAAKLAVELIKKSKVKIIPHRGKVDEKLVELAKLGYVVLTQDKELKKKIRDSGGKLACIRQGKYIELP